MRSVNLTVPYKDPEVAKKKKREYAKTYYENNKEKIQARNKKWAEDNRDRMNELQRNHYYKSGKDYQKKYREENPQIYSDAHKLWREKNADYELNRQKEYRENNRERERKRGADYRAKRKEKYNIPDRHGGKAQALLKGLLEEITGLEALEEVSFDWCRSTKNYIMRVDMFFPDLNLIVEYNGAQHYKPVKFGSSRTESIQKFVKQKKRDQLKYELIRKNGYVLLVVPYWESLTIKNVTVLLEEVLPSETTRTRS